MHIEVKHNNFIPLSNLIKINDLKSSIENYNFNENRLSGSFNIKGSFVVDDVDNLQSFDNTIPFDIIFTQNIKSIENVELINFEFFEIEGRGIELECTLVVTYKDDNPYDEITDDMDEKLKDELEVFDEPQEVERSLSVDHLILPTNESKTSIRIQFN